MSLLLLLGGKAPTGEGTLLDYGWETGDEPAPTTSGTVETSGEHPVLGTKGAKVSAGDSYYQWTLSSVLATTYYFRFYLRLAALPSGLTRVWQLLDTAGEVVCSLRVSATGVLQVFDHEGNQQGNTITLDPGKPYLIEPVVTQAAVGKGTFSLYVDNETVDSSLSLLMTNTKWNRLRVGLNTAGVTVAGGAFFDAVSVSDSARVGGTVFPSSPAALVPSGHGRRPVVPIGISQVNNAQLRSNTDRLAVRFIPDEAMTLDRFLMGFNMEGVDTNSKGEAAPSEIRNPGGTGRSGYGDGNGGTIRAQLVTCNADGTPDLSNVLATEEVNAVDRYEAAKALFTPGATHPNQILYLLFNITLKQGHLYAVVISNVHAKPLENFFSVNCPTTSIAAAGPNRSNTLSADASGAMAGLDPRECLFWSVDSGGHWFTGEKVGGDTEAQGIVPARSGGHISGCYSGYSELNGDEKVRLPWYGFMSSGDVVTAVQPYYGYLETATAPKLICRKAGRAVVLTAAGGFAPEGKDLGVVTVTNIATGQSSSTSSLKSGLVEGPLSAPVEIAAGETYTIEASGTSYLEMADSFQQAVFGLGGGDWPFSTEGHESNRAALFVTPWPYLAIPSSAGASRVAVSREFPPDRLAVRIVDPQTGATIARWAEDESKAENVISGLTKGGEMPGGYKESGCSLSRDPRVDWPDLQTYWDYIIEGPGREVIWEGRLTQKPESDGERMVVEPKAVGHQAALEDRNGLIGPGFIDCDLSKWGDASTQRKIITAQAGRNENGQVSTGWQGSGENGPGVQMSWPTIETNEDYAQVFYDSNGVPIGALYFDISFFNGIGEGWVFQPFLGNDDLIQANFDAGPSFVSTSAVNQAVTASAATRKFAMLEGRYTGTFEGNPNALMQWRPVIVGDQGLALQGEWPKVGFTAKQMLEYAIPLYTYLSVDSEAMEEEGVVIPQAWFSDPGNMATVVKELTKYELLDWFVKKGKVFQVRFPGTYGRRWQAYAGPSELKGAGEDGQRLWAEIVVRYQDVDGSTRTVGPPGSGANTESEALKITDPDHPAVKAGIPREDLLDLQSISTPERALEAGERWLALANELTNAGTATLRGYVMDDKGVYRPVSQVEAGDWIRFPDAGSNGTGYRKITTDSYSHDSRQCDITLDAPDDAIPALLERFQAALIPLALS